VRRLKTIVTLMLVALWLPASSHALLQHAGVIHVIHSHDDQGEHRHDADSSGSHEHDADNHDAADGLCLVSSGKVSPAKPDALPLLPWLMATVRSAAEPTSALHAHCGPSPPGTAAPDVSRGWQFSFRAALPIRAPSFVS
jgi:hypothetical protein